MSFEQFIKTTNKYVDKEALVDVIVQRRDTFYDPHKNAQWCKEQQIDFLFVGRHLGEQKKDFIPTPYGIEHISKYANDNQKVVLDEKGAWLFLCKRDPFGSSIKSGRAKKNRLVYLYDNADNLLGLGIWLVNEVTPREADKAVIKNLYDKGRYVRRE